MATTPAEPSDSKADQKQRMKAALDAKKGRSGFGSSGGDATKASAKNQASRAGGKREFRRKSGG
ncbi:MAG: DUF5302 family protein [Actinomycetes bacterium]